MLKCDKDHAKWNANMAKCSNTMQNAKWPCQNAANTMQQVLVPNCCEYKANGTGKESQKKIQNLRQKKSKNHSTQINSTYFNPTIFCVSCQESANAEDSWWHSPHRHRWTMYIHDFMTCIWLTSRSLGADVSNTQTWRFHVWIRQSKKCNTYHTPCLYIRIHIHIHIHIHIIYIYTSYTYIHIHIHIHTYTYIYIHTHTYTYIYIHTYTYIYILKCMLQ